jgi:hypothetical protein
LARFAATPPADAPALTLVKELDDIDLIQKDSAGAEVPPGESLAARRTAVAAPTQIG